jgi:hypothetical protein
MQGTLANSQERTSESPTVLLASRASKACRVVARWQRNAGHLCQQGKHLGDVIDIKLGLAGLLADDAGKHLQGGMYGSVRLVYDFPCRP